MVQGWSEYGPKLIHGHPWPQRRGAYGAARKIAGKKVRTCTGDGSIPVHIGMEMVTILSFP
jgi:hypothetical protein